jgi:hypothetical protein
MPVLDEAEKFDITDWALLCDWAVSHRVGSSSAAGTDGTPGNDSRRSCVVEEGSGLAPLGRLMRLLRSSAR